MKHIILIKNRWNKAQYVYAYVYTPKQYTSIKILV